MATCSEDATDSEATFLGRKRFAALAYRICSRQDFPIMSAKSLELQKLRKTLQHQFHRGMKGDTRYSLDMESIRCHIFGIESDLIEHELSLASKSRYGVSQRQAQKSLSDFRKVLLALVATAGTKDCFVFKSRDRSGAGQTYIRDVEIALPKLTDVAYTHLKAEGFAQYPQRVVGAKADFARGLYDCAVNIAYVLFRCERSLVSLVTVHGFKNGVFDPKTRVARAKIDLFR